MRIAVWPTGDWCEVKESAEFSQQNALGDDFAVYTAATVATAERIAANVEAGRPPLAA
ncbi:MULTISPECIES: hypothetical protein [Xanthomonas]|uniref:Uncharacterized protein n=3 Tax=Xanthomonas TaxID=338 RepID=A0AB73H2S4_9XANT|nr:MULTISPECIES: hypothetical protein [Xanthomonas]HDS1082427.1 hypothetical protein [Stenotrophomonas maltophilia]MBB5672268.1 hypothetical protein [Xanthomonas arboricola]MCC8577728.1 hypothetical protein [Xanthomonas euvesicatoria pv. euvesicatoria]MCC8588175.1 hypothetical protein [Xanthomonas euvesicatoria pv. euvesicatoria]MCC8637203.1 hypothetical protein [Xanthomonas euvesicatoria pv. euvesicatoria]